MEFSFVNKIDKEELSELFRSVEWRSGDFPEKLEQAVSGSDRVIEAREQGRLVGLVTAISDGALNVFFPYVLVHPEFQGKGVGRKMLERILKFYDGYYHIELLCKPDKKEFYVKNGFVQNKEVISMKLLTGLD